MKVRKPINIEGEEAAVFVAQVADALAHPVRVALLHYVRWKATVRNDVCNKDLVANFDYSQSSLSQHVRKLKEAGLFKVEYKNRFSFYSVDEALLRRYLDTLRDL
ncbi:MAG: ArsR family transcriptional regulator [Bacteroidota bacterium]